VQDIWLDFCDAHNQNIGITGYPTEKPLGLLKRIVEASSNPGDLVLDCFAGSGTALVAADMLDRQWIGMDSAPEAIRTILHRFAHGTQRMGDYVSKRKGRSKAPTLFDDYPKAAKPEHTIKDFSCLIDPRLRGVFPSLSDGMSAARSAA
jgi:adenine-specific DNA-methyltransferase